jgi:hypothetical protein
MLQNKNELNGVTATEDSGHELNSVTAAEGSGHELNSVYDVDKIIVENGTSPIEEARLVHFCLAVDCELLQEIRHLAANL